MYGYKLPEPIPPAAVRALDPARGFICLTVYWQPNPADLDPYLPGRKVHLSSYIPMSPDDECLCGSGRPFRACCQLQPGRHIVCPNPGGLGYSLYASPSATHEPVDGQAMRALLMADKRLHCVDERPASSFWLLWGDPPLESEYGILCFGDIELKANRTLLVTALSDLRMRLLLELLHEIAGEHLGVPVMHGSPALGSGVEIPNPGRQRSKGHCNGSP